MKILHFSKPIIAVFIIAFVILAQQGCTHEPIVEVSDPNCNHTNVTYSKSIVDILNIYCNGCHGSVPFSGNINLSTYDEVKYFALNGELLGVIKHDAGYLPMPQGGGKLSDCEISTIEKWITNGALKN